LIQETPLVATPQETGPPKRSIIHTRGSRKKAKVHKQLPEYTNTEDNVNYMEERVQYYAAKEFEEAQHQQGKIQHVLVDISQVLEQIKVAQRPERGT
jgi:hypothetical protein